MLGQARSRDVPTKGTQRLAHPGPAFLVQPPEPHVVGPSQPEPLGTHETPRSLEWSLVQSRFVLGRINSEVNDPEISRPTRKVQAVDPAADHIAIGAPVRVRGVE